MNATVTPLRPTVRPIDRVKSQPTQTSRMLAANIEINTLTQTVEDLCDVVEKVANALRNEPECKESLLNIARHARRMVT